MRHLSIAVIAAASTIALTQIASAADLGRPVYKAPPAPPPPAWTWTGFYLGVNGGYAWNADNSNVTAFNTEISEQLTNTDQQNLDPNGGFGGGQIGYNYQFAPQWVVGIEADIQGAGIKDSVTAAAINPVQPDSADPNAFVYAYAKTQLDWFGTVRGRLGYTVFERTLLYATGGFAFGGVKDSLNVSEISEGSPLGGTASRDHTATGFAVGGGVETFFTPNWSLKAEYQYIDLGSTTLATLAVNTTNAPEGIGNPDCCDRPVGITTIEHRYHTVRLGLNYKFSTY